MLGELPAWLVAGMITLIYCFGAAAVASGWSEYVQSFLGDYGLHLPAVLTQTLGKVVTMPSGGSIVALFNLPAFIIVLLLAAIVYRGAETSATFNAIIVAIKMTVILGFIVMGIGYIEPSNWVPFIPENTGKVGEFGLTGILAGAGIVLLAYTGFDAVATTAQETKNPKRDLPIGIVGSLVMCIIVYVLVSGVLTGLVSYKELNVSKPMAIAVAKMNMPWFATAIKIGAVAGLTSVILVLIFGSVRIFYTVTHDGLLPKFLAKVHRKYHTPHILTIIMGLVIATLAAVVPMNMLLKMANFGTIITYIVVCVGTIYLRYKKPDLKREFECPMVPFVPLLGIVLFALILVSLHEVVIYIAGWLVFLLVVYFGYSSKNSHLLHPQRHHHPVKQAAKPQRKLKRKVA
jgi:APA family basic amino acid/polyamine antiporter